MAGPYQYKSSWQDLSQYKTPDLLEGLREALDIPTGTALDETNVGGQLKHRLGDNFNFFDSSGRGTSAARRFMNDVLNATAAKKGQMAAPVSNTMLDQLLRAYSGGQQEAAAKSILSDTVDIRPGFESGLGGLQTAFSNRGGSVDQDFMKMYGGSGAATGSHAFESAVGNIFDSNKGRITDELPEAYARRQLDALRYISSMIGGGVGQYLDNLISEWDRGTDVTGNLYNNLLPRLRGLLPQMARARQYQYGTAY